MQGGSIDLINYWLRRDVHVNNERVHFYFHRRSWKVGAIGIITSPDYGFLASKFLIEHFTIVQNFEWIRSS